MPQQWGNESINSAAFACQATRAALLYFCCGFSAKNKCFPLLFSGFLFSLSLCFRNSSASQRCFDQALCVCFHACIYTCKPARPCQECSYLIISGKSQTFFENWTWKVTFSIFTCCLSAENQGIIFFTQPPFCGSHVNRMETEKERKRKWRARAPTHTGGDREAGRLGEVTQRGRMTVRQELSLKEKVRQNEPSEKRGCW